MITVLRRVGLNPSRFAISTVKGDKVTNLILFPKKGASTSEGWNTWQD